MVEIIETTIDEPESEAEIKEVEEGEEVKATDDVMELVEPDLPPGPKPTRPDSVHDTEMWSKRISCLFLVKANCLYFFLVSHIESGLRSRISDILRVQLSRLPLDCADFDSNNAKRLILPALETAISDSKLLTPSVTVWSYTLTLCCYDY